jgi:hypothetical protein
MGDGNGVAVDVFEVLPAASFHRRDEKANNTASAPWMIMTIR